MDKIKLFFLGNRKPAYSDELKTQLLLIARLLVGGYVLYLGKDLVPAIVEATSISRMAVFTAVVVVFTVAGGVLLYMSLRDLAIGRYVGGKLDLGERETEESENNVE